MGKKGNIAGNALRSLGFAALIGVLGCDQLQPSTPMPAPPSRPDGLVEPLPSMAAPILTPNRVDEDSAALRIHYQRLQNDLLAQGLMRTDGGGPDTPFTDTMLARNFVRIALFDEYVADAGGFRAQPTISNLRRWDRPIRMNIAFGDSIPEDQRVTDTNSVRGYANRLARLTGLTITQSRDNANFHVLVLNENDRRGYETQLRALVPDIDASTMRAIIDLPRDTLCLVVAFSEANNASYSRAVALIRGEHPDLMRLACVHEEIAQGLGLANDSPQARPSIFNDDEEFGLLTTHDEMLLKMLYDPRLQNGMTAAEAAPIARVIARELLADGAS
ncbi:DUF2927 domain-containing protein [Octadecabacter sp. R77987]|uniref:DUF2927 domain-containing protein n=1 Tax=Octadecabacter sp. R77987 TaxID=3093874 RepID=UPI00366D6CE3